MKWMFVLSSLIGDYLNVQKMWIGFLFWIFCDVYFCYYNIIQGEFAEAVLFFIYLMFAIYGIYRWKIK